MKKEILKFGSHPLKQFIFHSILSLKTFILQVVFKNSYSVEVYPILRIDVHKSYSNIFTNFKDTDNILFTSYLIYRIRCENTALVYLRQINKSQNSEFLCTKLNGK